MELNRDRMRGLRRGARAALGGLLAVTTAGAAHALTYTTGDVIGVLVNSGAELMVDMGPLSGLTSGSPFNFTTPSNFGAVGGLGGIFTAFEVNAPFANTAPRSLTFTTAPSVNPVAFDNQLSPYVTRLPAGQLYLDNGAGTGWLVGLSNFPAAGGPNCSPSQLTNCVILSTSNELAILTSNPGSYTNGPGLGTNQLNNLLPFSTAASLTTNGQMVDLWTGTRTGVKTSSTSLLGMFTVNGNSLGDGSQISLSFTPVPEPGTLLLVTAGLAGLLWVGRTRGAE